MASINVQICLAHTYVPEANRTHLAERCQLLCFRLCGNAAVEAGYPFSVIQKYDMPFEDFIWISHCERNQRLNSLQLKNYQKPNRVWIGEEKKQRHRGQEKVTKIFQYNIINIPQNFLSFYSLIKQEVRGDGKNITSDEYVRALIQLSPL